MKVRLSRDLVEAMMNTGTYADVIGEMSWAKAVDIKVTSRNVDRLEEIADKLNATGLKEKLQHWRVISESPGTRKVKAFPDLVDILTEYLIEKTPDGIIWSADGGGPPLPYVVTKIEYHDATEYSPSRVALSASYYLDGRVGSSTWQWTWDERGGFAADYLDKKGLFIPNDELTRQYEEHRQRLIEIRPLVGKQFTATGAADSVNSYGSWDTVYLGDGDDPARLVIDTDLGEDEKAGTIPRASSEIYGDVTVPMHPFVRCFDLRKHFTVTMHVALLHEYVYDPSLRNKLILPQRTSDIIDVLLADTKSDFKDIVAGKSGGIIVLAKGPPGTGKTLTAEVCAEALERPLYVVQCAQLGLDHGAVEKNLQKVLGRAAKWGALLLIDEADVYIHHRGEDLEQNAIVGVFLRTLEYFNGVLFLTTNRATIVDDAIVSRLTASVEYGRPGRKELETIWRVLSETSGIAIDPALPAAYAEAHPHTSGRDVKVLLKLANMHARHNGSDRVSMDNIEAVLPFKPGVGSGEGEPIIVGRRVPA